ncbi:MAG: 16S rRNA (cytosine(1402)-N(4))-methyltransferase RsmH [Pseudomonadota bacterium]
MRQDVPVEPRKDFFHLPVMAGEVVAALGLKPGNTVIDTTLGGGGHAALILEAISPSGKLIGIDQDKDALSAAQKKLSWASGRVTFVHGKMGDIKKILRQLGVTSADGIIADLGVSSFQLNSADRGFSFRGDGPLDMRMDKSSGRSAQELLSEIEEEELALLIKNFGEERHARRIAKALAGKKDIKTTAQLAQAVTDVMPKHKGPSRIHPATRVFQALRIAVNDELGELTRLLKDAPTALTPGGRLVVISYHSLEDRMVKRAFRDLAGTKEFSLPHRRVKTPSDEEIFKNPRARSAKMRTLERVKR